GLVEIRHIDGRNVVESKNAMAGSPPGKKVDDLLCGKYLGGIVDSVAIPADHHDLEWRERSGVDQSIQFRAKGNALRHPRHYVAGSKTSIERMSDQSKKELCGAPSGTTTTRGFPSANATRRLR